MAGVDRKPRGRPSPFFEGWAREYAWPERARAHDHHLELIRERGMEKVIEEEAAKQARQAERVRGRFNELRRSPTSGLSPILRTIASSSNCAPPMSCKF